MGDAQIKDIQAKRLACTNVPVDDVGRISGQAWAILQN